LEVSNARYQLPSWFGRPRKLLAADDARLTLVLSSFGGILAAAAIFFCFVLPLTPARMVRSSSALIRELPLWSFVEQFSSPALQDPRIIAALLVGFVILAFAAYALTIYLTWNRPRQSSTPVFAVVGGAVTLFYLSTWALPNSNTDIFNYIARGRVAAAHDANPYYVAVDEFPDDPIYPYASHRYTANPGGKFPAWMWVNISLAKLAGDDPLTNLLLYRFALFFFNLANLAMIGFLCHRLNPRSLLAGLTLYSWNPVIFMFGQHKTDVVMLFFLLLAAASITASRKQFAVIPLTLSVFVKLITAPLLLVFLLHEAKSRRWRELGASILIAAATVTVIYLPFLQDLTLPFQHLFKMGEGGSSAASVLRPVIVLGFLLLIPGVGLTRRDDPKHLIRGWSLIMLYFSLFLTNFAFSWYLMTFVAIASLTADWRIFLATIALTFSSFLINVWGSASSEQFPLPYPVIVHRHFVYLLPLVVVGAGVGGYALWYRRRAAGRSPGAPDAAGPLAASDIPEKAQATESGASFAAPRTFRPEADRRRPRSSLADRSGLGHPSEPDGIPRAKDGR
jgi:hypothetical protein